MALVFIAAIALGAGTIAIIGRPGVTRGESFLFGDEGHALWAADAVLQGRDLYVDVATPYAPLTHWLYAGTARLFGLSPLSYQFLNLALSIAAVVLLTAAIGRWTGRRWAFAWSLVALLPVTLAPGSLVGGLTISPYIGLERVILALMLVLWEPPQGRAAWRSIMVGLALGMLHWVRFGMLALGAAVVIVADLLAGRSAWRQTGVVMAAAAVPVTLALIWIWSTLPGPIARDVAWPSYLRLGYDWVTPDVRWPALGPVRVLAGQYGGVAGGLLLIAVALRRARQLPAVSLAAGCLAMFSAGAALLFLHAFHYRQFAWVLVAAGGLAGMSVSLPWRMAAMAIALPAAAVMARGLLQQDAAAVRVATPLAGDVYVTRSTADRLEALAAELAAARAGRQTLVVGPHAEGWHAAFGVPVPTRHGYHLTGWVRPYEYGEIAAAYDGVSSIVICPAGSLDRLRLPEVLREHLARRFTRQRAVADCLGFNAQ